MQTSYSNEQMKVGGRTAYVTAKVKDYLTSNELAEIVAKAIRLAKPARQKFLVTQGILELEINFEGED